LYQEQYERRREVELMGVVARRAGAIAMRYWNSGLKAETKSDDSPVTIADRECEREISRALEEAFPDDGLLGEEGASKESRSGRRWIIDPIDGTRDFVRGNRAWSVLIGLEEAGEVVAGVSYLPAVDEMFTAARGAGAFLNGKRILASDISEASQAVLCVNQFTSVLKYGFSAGLLEWMSKFWAVRSMGGCLDAMMVCRGQADLWIETGGKPWDFAPLKIIAEEAGARFFNFDGGSSIYAGNCVVCAPGMEAIARKFVVAPAGSR
jgi:histidinol phosphatase-like enzyme (inositol monophosphatase family)